MSLQTRLSALITAIGADIKSLQSRATALELHGPSAWEDSDSGVNVGVANDNVWRDVLRADSGPLGSAASYVVSDGAAHKVFVSGHVYFEPNADLWIMVAARVAMVRLSDNFLIAGTEYRTHAYGTQDDTSRPHSQGVPAQARFALPAGNATWQPRIQIRCFGGLGGGSYTRAGGFNHIGCHRI